MRYPEAGDLRAGIRMYRYSVVSGNPANRDSTGHVDAYPNGALVQIGLAMGFTCRQPHHGHDRVTTIDNHPDIGHAVISQAGKRRVKMHERLDHRDIGLPTQ